CCRASAVSRAATPPPAMATRSFEACEALSGTTVTLRPELLFAVVLAPDEPVERDTPGNGADAGDEGDADERQAEDRHHEQHEDVGVFGSLERFDLVPHR